MQTNRRWKIVAFTAVAGVLLAACNQQFPVEDAPLPPGESSTSREDLTIVPPSCCTAFRLQIHPGAQSLIQSYRNLVAGTGVSRCGPPPQTYNISSAMQTQGYSHQTGPGYLTFTSFFRDDYNYFRTIWADAVGDFTYYGACSPSPIVFRLPPSIENHVFEARLVSVAAYRISGGPRTWPMSGVGEVRVTDIEEIRGVYVEGSSGYIATTEPGNYNSIHSSKGIVIEAMLRGRIAFEKFYLINNYDGAGTVTWKAINYCG